MIPHTNNVEASPARRLGGLLLRLVNPFHDLFSEIIIREPPHLAVGMMSFHWRHPIWLRSCSKRVEKVNTEQGISRLLLHSLFKGWFIGFLPFLSCLYIRVGCLISSVSKWVEQVLSFSGWMKRYYRGFGLKLLSLCLLFTGFFLFCCRFGTANMVVDSGQDCLTYLARKRSRGVFHHQGPSKEQELLSRPIIKVYKE